MNDNHVPEYWPPQAGDLWRDSYPRGGYRPRPSELWFVIDHPDYGIQFVGLTGTRDNPERVRHAYGPMTLARRNGDA